MRDVFSHVVERAGQGDDFNNSAGGRNRRAGRIIALPQFCCNLAQGVERPGQTQGQWPDQGQSEQCQD